MLQEKPSNFYVSAGLSENSSHRPFLVDTTCATRLDLGLRRGQRAQQRGAGEGPRPDDAHREQLASPHQR